MTGRPLLAVLGSPIAHSQSPALHEAAYRVLGFDGEYGSAEVGSGMLGAFIDGLGPSWRGLSLTMPLKEEVLPLLDSVDRLTTLTGAANTVLFTPEGGRMRRDGFNTDVAGIVGALAEAEVTSCRELLVLGSGATARSAIVAGASLGAERVVIAARSVERAATAVEVAGASGVAATVIPLGDALDGTIDSNRHSAGLDVSTSVTVSTLPGGVLDSGDVSAVAPGPGAVLLDVAYAPWPSLLGAAWQSGGGEVVSGLVMLVHQALVQVRVFVNGDPEAVLENEQAVLAAMFDAVGIRA